MILWIYGSNYTNKFPISDLSPPALHYPHISKKNKSYQMWQPRQVAGSHVPIAKCRHFLVFVKSRSINPYSLIVNSVITFQSEVFIFNFLWVWFLLIFTTNCSWTINRKLKEFLSLCQNILPKKCLKIDRKENNTKIHIKQNTEKKHMWLVNETWGQKRHEDENRVELDKV